MAPSAAAACAHAASQTKAENAAHNITFPNFIFIAFLFYFPQQKYIKVACARTRKKGGNAQMAEICIGDTDIVALRHSGIVRLQFHNGTIPQFHNPTISQSLLSLLGVSESWSR
jgi:hypothetical protein